MTPNFASEKDASNLIQRWFDMSNQDSEADISKSGEKARTSTKARTKLYQDTEQLASFLKKPGSRNTTKISEAIFKELQKHKPMETHVLSKWVAAHTHHGSKESWNGAYQHLSHLFEALQYKPQKKDIAKVSQANSKEVEKPKHRKKTSLKKSVTSRGLKEPWKSGAYEHLAYLFKTLQYKPQFQSLPKQDLSVKQEQIAKIQDESSNYFLAIQIIDKAILNFLNMPPEKKVRGLSEQPLGIKKIIASSLDPSSLISIQAVSTKERKFYKSYILECFNKEKYNPSSFGMKNFSDIKKFFGEQIKDIECLDLRGLGKLNEKDLSEFKNLKSLVLRGDNYQLKSLGASSSNYPDELDEEINLKKLLNPLKNLEKLSFVDWKEKCGLNLTFIHSLKSLSCSNCLFDEIICSNTDLEVLNLEECSPLRINIGDKIKSLDFLQSCAETIEYLHIRSPLLVNFDELKNCKKLRELALRQTPIEDLNFLSGCGESLVFLSLECRELTNFNALKDCPKLAQLFLSSLPIKDLKFLKPCGPSLEMLVLTSCTLLEDIRSIRNLCPKLEYLGIFGCPQFQDFFSTNTLKQVRVLLGMPVLQKINF